MKVGQVIVYISMGSVLIPLFVSLFVKKSMFKHLPYVLAVLIISLVCDVVGYGIAISGFTNNWVSNFFFLSQSLLLIKIFGDELNEKRIALFIATAYFVFFIANMALIQGPFILNIFSFILGCFILSCYSFHYFYRLLSDMPVVYIHRLPMLWLAFAVLIYHAGNFFVFMATAYLLDANVRYWIGWSLVHNMLNITKNVLFAVALWHSYRATKSPIS